MSSKATLGSCCFESLTSPSDHEWSSPSLSRFLYITNIRSTDVHARQKNLPHHFAYNKRDDMHCLSRTKLLFKRSKPSEVSIGPLSASATFFDSIRYPVYPVDKPVQISFQVSVLHNIFHVAMRITLLTNVFSGALGAVKEKKNLILWGPFD
ncbi:uncharacterized protein BYT42DRAFT_588784 [Radiomyces spectabilis]|uniref:uncharacterized protein n=1 Tax=Radiomyces spectabilis TaxID=64574 RepID=UPI00221FA77B|nr:uncharacterized protein BYT42DRAFT_588784 [Radiomyces spectabilis]KAI8366067.1 hypothetical protein BYT42DRAFT_588784 [Radiomyces spectabilis]